MWVCLRYWKALGVMYNLILSSQASTRSGIVGKAASALTAQSAFLDNFENIVNRRVDIREDIKHYEDTLSYTSSKVDYSVGENIYMLPSDMNLKIETIILKIIQKSLLCCESTHCVANYSRPSRGLGT